MLLAIRQDGLGMLFVQEVEGKMGGDVAKREGHHWMMLQAVVDSVRIGVCNVVRQCNLDDPIRLSSLRLFTPKLQAHKRSQMKLIGRRDLGSGHRAKRLGIGCVSNRQLDLLEPLCGRAWQRSLHRGLRLGLPPFILIPIEYSVLDRQAACQK